MASRKRDEPETPVGKKRIFPTGGKVGRTPGLGTRNNAGTKPGQGLDRPTQGYGLSGSRRKPPLEERPQPKTNQQDDTQGGESGN